MSVRRRRETEVPLTGAQTPQQLEADLRRLVAGRVPLSVMIWGPPGVGKSSIVAQVASETQLSLIDLRLSQLAPTDLRGLPVPGRGVARWLPPEFLPRTGRGVLLLDELNMAPPAMQGIAQQLILDRRVGSYEVPVGWFVWAAGNRREDRASVFEMPAPLANRFIHLTVQPDLAAFRTWGMANRVHEQVLAFLAFRPLLLHCPSPTEPAWPSPRSWAMASQLLSVGVPVEAAVGPEAGAEFRAFTRLYASLPDLDAICAGTASGATYPTEASARYAVGLGLVYRARTAAAMEHALRWMARTAPAEWLAGFLVDLFRQGRELGTTGPLAQAIQRDPALRDLLTDYRDLMLQ